MAKRPENTATIHHSEKLDEAITITETRMVWALVELINAGARGCTPVDNPAPRWSGYIKKLRDVGINIETIHEVHGGLFQGNHGRYVLRSRVTISGPTVALCNNGAETASGGIPAEREAA